MPSRPLVLPYVVDRAKVAAETEAFLHHRRFDDAVRLYAGIGLDRFDGDPRTSKLVCQTARYVLALAILHLDANTGPAGEGATATRLRDTLTPGGWSSTGWVKGALHVFRHAGYVIDEPSAGDRRRKRVVPSPVLMEIAIDAMIPTLRALAVVAPLPLPAEDLARAPGFVGAAATHTMVPNLTDGFSPLEAMPEMAPILRRDFGFVVFCTLIRSTTKDEGGPDLAEAPSVVLARRFGMARAQARNLLGLCREWGWIVAAERGGRNVTLSPHFAELSRRWIAHDLACWSCIVRASARDIGLVPPKRRASRRQHRASASTPAGTAA